MSEFQHSERGRLFVVPKRERQLRRNLMRVIDAGPAEYGVDRVHLRCGRCGHDAGWVLMRRGQAKRGVPCPKCNKQSEGE